MQSKPEQAIPEQTEGVATDTTGEVTLGTEEEAKDYYQKVKERLLNINAWQQYTGAAFAAFVLTNSKGQPVERLPQVGDHFRIDIPGPGSRSGEGYDWVQIEALEAEDQPGSACQIIRVRPATNPTNDKADIAHFFAPDATSTFMVRREGQTVKAEVHGRNEKPNTQTEAVVDALRHTAVATGAFTGFSKLQWKSLVNGLLAQEDTKV